jgi:DNA-binding HxlR family transcriptional regulator
LPFSISEIEEACPGISRDMVRVILRAMKAEGLIQPTGKGRAAKWVQKQQGS